MVIPTARPQDSASGICQSHPRLRQRKGHLRGLHKDTSNDKGSTRKTTGFSVEREPVADKQPKSRSPDTHRSIRRFYTECAGRARLVVTRGVESDLASWFQKIETRTAPTVNFKKNQ